MEYYDELPLHRLDQTPVSSSDFTGDKTLLVFFRAAKSLGVEDVGGVSSGMPANVMKTKSVLTVLFRQYTASEDGPILPFVS